MIPYKAPWYPDDPGMHNAGRGPGAPVLPSAFAPRRDESTFVERVSNSFTGSMLGLGLLAMGILVITMNESMAAHVSWQLEERLHDVVPLETAQVIFTENNNKLVHVTGQLRTTEPLVDGQFGISVRAVKLRRHVQMYQWLEHRKPVGPGSDDIHYTYTREWRSDLIDSDTFHYTERHSNKKQMSIQGTTFVAVRAYVGNFQLKESLKEHIENFEAYILDNPAPNDPNIKFYKGFYYYAAQPMRPVIGDIRVTYSVAGVSGHQEGPLGRPDSVSILARQAGAMLTSYITPSGWNRELLQIGNFTAEEMLIRHFRFDTSLTWYLRIGGWFVIFLGFSFMKLIVFYLMDMFPPFRRVAAFGLINSNLCISFSVAVFFASLLYLLTRPLWALAMMTVASLPIIFIFAWHRLFPKSSRQV